jgi:GNAT superfamily N-acetyltransferase
MSTHTLRKHARYVRPPVTPASAGESWASEALVPLRRDLLPACATLMLDRKARRHIGAMTPAAALKRLETCFDDEGAVGVALLNAWRQPIAFALGRVELDMNGAPVRIYLCELRVAAHARRAGLGTRLIEFLRQQCNGAPADFDGQAPRQQVSEWISML